MLFKIIEASICGEVEGKDWQIGNTGTEERVRTQYPGGTQTQGKGEARRQGREEKREEMDSVGMKLVKNRIRVFSDSSCYCNFLFVLSPVVLDRHGTVRTRRTS